MKAHRAIPAVGLVLVVSIACLAAEVDRSKSAFPPVLRLKGAVDTSAKPPSFGYVSGSAGGAFTLNGPKGHAAFRWNHELDVDWHDHDTRYLGRVSDSDGNYYWVYTLKYGHEGHIDKVWLYFAETEVPDDLGFRIFFGHAFYADGTQEPQQPEEHDMHIWCVDAVRFGPHLDHATAAAPKASRFNMLMSE